MVADMSVGIAGMHEVVKELQEHNKKNDIRNKHLDELVKINKLLLTEEKPEVAFLFELLDFLKSIPVWMPPGADNTDKCQPKACFVGQSWNGKVISYRDHENLMDFYEIDGEAIYFDVSYYVNRLDKALAALYPAIFDRSCKSWTGDDE